MSLHFHPINKTTRTDSALETGDKAERNFFHAFAAAPSKTSQPPRPLTEANINGVDSSSQHVPTPAITHDLLCGSSRRPGASSSTNRASVPARASSRHDLDTKRRSPGPPPAEGSSRWFHAGRTTDHARHTGLSLRDQAQPSSLDTSRSRLDEHRRRLAKARAAFKTYLEKDKPQYHFVSVTVRENPLRRADPNPITSSSRRATIRESYMWDDSRGRWTTKNGLPLVLEDEIYDIILSHQRLDKQGTRKSWYEEIKAVAEGIHYCDVGRAKVLWYEYKLADLDENDDDLWGRPPAPNVPHSMFRATPSDSIPNSISTDETMMTIASTGSFKPSTSPIPSNSTPWEFHEMRSDALLIGHSYIQDTPVWMSIGRRGRSQDGQPNTAFWDKHGTKRSEKDLDIVWNEQFEKSRFGKKHDSERAKTREQRKYVYEIIHKEPIRPSSSLQSASLDLADLTNLHTSRNTDTSRIRMGENCGAACETGGNLLGTRSISAGTSNKRRRSHHQETVSTLDDDFSDDDGPLVSKRSRYTDEATQPANNTTDSSNDVEHVPTNPIQSSVGDGGPGPSYQIPGLLRSEPFSSAQAPTIPGLPSELVEHTILQVTEDDKPQLAPADIRLNQCTTLEQLFETLIVECRLRGTAAAELYRVSVTYKGGPNDHCIRRNHPSDWDKLRENLCRVWEDHPEWFLGDEYEVQLRVHLA